jgi:hypothetical protein
MSVIVTVSALLALVAAGVTLVYAVTVRSRATKLGPVGSSAVVARLEQDPATAGALADRRSCFQVSLQLISDALDEAIAGHLSRAEQSALARRTRMILNLLDASPAISLSFVIEDRILADLERTTTADCVWIISPDESIEFEYPDPTTSFSGVVLENLRRGVRYRYLSINTDATRDRAHRLLALTKGQAEQGQFQIRFLSPDYWATLRTFTDEIVLFTQPEAATAFYRFPDGKPARRWVQAPRADAKLRADDIRATWELAEPVDPIGAPQTAYA